jgi:hypothetical protein
VHNFFSIEQSFLTPYFHIVFLTKMIWKKRSKVSKVRPKQGVSTFGDWILHKNLYPIISIAIKCSKQQHTMIIYICRQCLNSHLFWLNSHPFFHPKPGRTQVWGLWSIRAQLENLPTEVIELIKEHTLKL